MKKYWDLITQTFDFPTKEFKVENDELQFNDVPLMDLIQQHGTPLKIWYLPKITSQIQRAKRVFQNAIDKHQYGADYVYAYCTKSNHFKFVLETVLKEKAQLETSSTYDIHIIRKLYADGLINKDITIICNGYKTEGYRREISSLINDGFYNCTPVLDTLGELDYYLQLINGKFKVGIRVAADEEPDFDTYTSRMGIRYNNIMGLYEEKIRPNERVELSLLHFFINSGIRDNQYYWSELNKFIYKYAELKQFCPTLKSVDIGGGFPIINSLSYEYDHEYMAGQIVEIIKDICDTHQVARPNIVTEFGNYTVGESGAVIYSILEKKQQNDKEMWYIIDGSLITHIPDTWGKKYKFVMMAINNWQNDFAQVHLGGITCDSDDYYNKEQGDQNIFLPHFERNKGEKQYIGFFHTGAYQESLGGFGGTSHCLIPDPKMVVIDKDEDGQHTYRVFKNQQEPEEMLRILGYGK